MRPKAIAFVCVAVMFLSNVRLFAQDQPAVFMHGLNSSGSTWQEAAQRLAARLAIEPHRPSTNWRELYQVQTDEIERMLGSLPPNTIAIGHSNGGIVGREWSRRHSLAGVVTVGTPHQGAPLVWNALSYANFDLALVAAISNVFNLFQWEGVEWEWVIAGIGNALVIARALSRASFLSVIAAVGLNIAAPVFPQMLPGSVYVRDLNSTANLEREAAQIADRVGIVAVARNFYWGGPIRAAWPQQGDRYARFRDTGFYALVSGALTIEILADPTNMSAHWLVTQMMRAANFLANMDPIWCGTVSWPGGSQCWRNDTIVPVWTQDYEALGGTLIFTGHQGPAHTQQTSMSDDFIQDALTRYLDVPTR